MHPFHYTVLDTADRFTITYDLCIHVMLIMDVNLFCLLLAYCDVIKSVVGVDVIVGDFYAHHSAWVGPAVPMDTENELILEIMDRLNINSQH